MKPARPSDLPPSRISAAPPSGSPKSASPAARVPVSASPAARVPVSASTAARSQASASPSSDPVDLRTQIGFLVSVVARCVHQTIDRQMEPLDLTAMQWKPMYALWTGRASTAAELAVLAGVDAGAMTRMLDRLEAKGLIRRERDASDRRIIRIALTPAGRRVGARVPDVLASVQQCLLHGLSDVERRQLRVLLERLITNLQEDLA